MVLTMETDVIERFSLFDSYKKKETFFTVIGLLFFFYFTLARAAELLEMSREEFSRILKLIGLEYSYLTQDEVLREKKASESL